MLESMHHNLRNHFAQRIADDAGGAGAFEFGDQFAFQLVFHDDFDGGPGAVGEGGDRGGFLGGQQFENGFELVLGGR